MLSYRHSFHAGNFADIIKHAVLVEILQYLTKKDSPFEYIDTHSGAGLFDLSSSDANKLLEHSNGIVKILDQNTPELASYLAVVKSFNQGEELNFYPGSPMIAKHFLRAQDRAWLYELHPQDYTLLCKNMGQQKKIRVSCEDGLKGLLAITPPTSRRGLVLIDPSYEVKTEYDEVFYTVVEAYKKFSNGIYAVWYPVVDRQRILAMEKKFTKSGIKNIQRFELGISEDSTERGMTSSGLFVINPPWQLFDNMSRLLPKLADIVSESGKPYFKCDVISEE